MDAQIVDSMHSKRRKIAEFGAIIQRCKAIIDSKLNCGLFA